MTQFALTRNPALANKPPTPKEKVGHVECAKSKLEPIGDNGRWRCNKCFMIGHPVRKM